MLEVFELAVRVVAVADPIGQPLQPVRVEITRVADQPRLDLFAVLGSDRVGQLLDRSLDDPRLPLGDLPGHLGGSDIGEHRRQPFAGQRPTRTERVRRLHPLVRLMRVQPQQAAQETARTAHEHRARQPSRLHLEHERMIRGRQPAPQPLLLTPIRQQLLIRQAAQIEPIERIQDSVRARQLDHRVDPPQRHAHPFESIAGQTSRPTSDRPVDRTSVIHDAKSRPSCVSRY
jgi:hypothetical protein